MHVLDPIFCHTRKPLQLSDQVVNEMKRVFKLVVSPFSNRPLPRLPNYEAFRNVLVYFTDGGNSFTPAIIADRLCY